VRKSTSQYALSTRTDGNTRSSITGIASVISIC
jgi:hypothetical protein